MGMPIDNHIEAISYGGLDNGFHTSGIAFRVFEEAPVILRAHSDAHDTSIPISSEGFNRPRRVEAILPPTRIGSEKARPRE